MEINNIEFALAIGYFGIAFMLYAFSLQSIWLEDKFYKISFLKERNVPFVYLNRFLGFLLLGFFPYIGIIGLSSISPSQLGMGIPDSERVTLWWIIPTGILLIIMILRPGKNIDTSFYPSARIPTWHLPGILVNGLTWIVYLIGYEFAFRGYLFFLAIDAVGLIPAIMINCSIYGISHIPKGAGEAFGAFFLGFLFCVLAHQTNSIGIPLVMHIILAIGNDFTAIKVNPDMRIVI